MVGLFGRVPKWSKGADCKSAIRRFESGRGLLAIQSVTTFALVAPPPPPFAAVP